MTTLMATLTLTRDERAVLRRFARRGNVARRTALRAKIVPACAAGASNRAVAVDLRVTPQTVGNGRRQFVDHRLDGLLDEPRCGTQRAVTGDQVRDVVVRTPESTPNGCTHWSRWPTPAGCARRRSAASGRRSGSIPAGRRRP